MESAILNGMCRCCASEGVFKDVKTAYTWMGEEEVYADMLRECFNVGLSASEDGEDGGICEVCITQLRNASNFKKQVLHTEEQFKKHASNRLFKPSIVKVEMTPDEDNDSDDNNLSAEEGYSGPEFEVPIKTESEETKPKKRAAASKATTSRAKKAKTDNGESSTKRIEPASMIEIEVDTSCIIFTGDYMPTSMTQNENETQFVKPEVEKHRENIRTILHCTNATPIGRYGSLGYTCCYCSEQYIEAKELKAHTIERHDEDAISAFMSNYTMLNYIVKLDITKLRCDICKKEITELQEMIDHLTMEHEQFFHKDIPNHIVPFRFDSDKLHCTECPSEYGNFKILLEHMNTHYSNHICEVCEAGFVNKRMMQAHMYRHKTGVFQCGYCTKVFDTRIKMKVHERVVHLYVKKRPKCNICERRFKDYNKMIKHEEKAHRVVREFNCEVCRKMFTSERGLTIHKRFHCTSDT